MGRQEKFREETSSAKPDRASRKIPMLVVPGPFKLTFDHVLK